MRKFHPEEVRAYLDPASAPHELDHIFVDRVTYEHLEDCRVIDSPVLAELSDHAPIATELQPNA
jgi:endonuclease/exonuclease/phosphatase family metal-dependent hydrolase